MRSVPLVGGAVWLAFVGAAAAQTPAYTAVVSRDDAEVRAGPSENAQFYVTNRLKRGTPVQVVEELGNGWLKIQPPAGSFSWINTRFLTQIAPSQPNATQANWVVDGHPDVRAPVIVGTDFSKDVAAQIESSRLPRGAQVTSVGPARVDDQGQWLPVVPPAGECRYLRADAVTRTDGTVPARTAALVTSARPAGLTPMPANAAPTDAEAAWMQAQQAERSGNLPVAVDLYLRTAALCQNSNPELALQANNRAHWLRGGTQAQYHSVFTPASAARPATNAELAAPTNLQTNNSQPSTPSAFGPGRLRRAGRCLEGRRTYVLDSVQGYPLVYATAEAGVELEPYLNQTVQLYGVAGYSGELRANWMRVGRVQVVSGQ